MSSQSDTLTIDVKLALCVHLFAQSILANNKANAIGSEYLQRAELISVGLTEAFNMQRINAISPSMRPRIVEKNNGDDHHAR